MSSGYKCGRIDRKTYLAHRVIWMLVHGEWPEHEIDHINGDKTDNRLVNLRCVDRATNGKNLKRKSNNTSGTTGVNWDKWTEQWKACIYVNGKNINLGRFASFDDAVTARKRAETEYCFHRNHDRVVYVD